MIEIPILILALIAFLFVGLMLSARRWTSYVFCCATVSAWETRLLPENRLMELAEAPRLENLLSALEGTDYRLQAAELLRGELDLATVEKALRESSNARYRELLKLVPEERRETVRRILARVDLWNLKALLTMIHQGVPRERRLGQLMPSPTLPQERLELLASAGNLKELLEFLKGSEYFEVLSSALKDYEEKGLSVLLLALERQYYASLWREVLAKRAQLPILKTLIGYEIDALNVRLILRLKSEGVAPEEIDGLLVRPSYELTEGMLKAMVSSEDLPSAMSFIRGTLVGRVLEGVSSKIGEEGLHAAERALEEGHLRLCRAMALAQPFSLAPVISYLLLRETEMKNLRTIIRLKAEGVEPQRIKELLVRVPRLEV